MHFFHGGGSVWNTSRSHFSFFFPGGFGWKDRNESEHAGTWMKARCNHVQSESPADHLQRPSLPEALPREVPDAD